jgi:transposase
MVYKFAMRDLTSALFEEPGQPVAQPSTRPLLQDPKTGARLREANRTQIFFETTCLDEQLPADNPARTIWAVIEKLDLSALYQQIDARSGGAGAPAIDPKILLALWVFATSQGEGSAREIGRLTRLHIAYRWLCGGVDAGYHTLSDFRSQQGQVIDELITQVLALLMHHKLSDLTRVAQDGTRVRASAGAASFRREETLQELKEQAEKHLTEVTREGKAPAWSARRAAAEKRGAAERVERLGAALEQIPQVKETK